MMREHKIVTRRNEIQSAASKGDNEREFGKCERNAPSVEDVT